MPKEVDQKTVTAEHCIRDSYQDMDDLRKELITETVYSLGSRLGDIRENLDNYCATHVVSDEDRQQIYGMLEELEQGADGLGEYNILLEKATAQMKEMGLDNPQQRTDLRKPSERDEAGR